MQALETEHPAQALERAVGEPIPTAPGHAARIEASSPGTVTLFEQLPATETFKVSVRSRPSAVAGAIAGVLRQHGQIEVQTIGAGATNQAIKAIAIARAYLVDDGIDVCVVPSFIDLLIDGQDRSALRLLIQQQPG